MCADLAKGALQCFVYTHRENHRALELNRIHHIELGVHNNSSNLVFISKPYVYDPGGFFPL